nr:hypothetical protein [Hydrococcus rivularis]
MRIQPSVLVHLGFGKYVRSDQVTAVIPIEEGRGPGRRTLIYLQGQTEPIVASRAEDSIVRDLVQEPREIVQARQQQEILSDLLMDLHNVNPTIRRIVRDESGLDLERLEQRIREVIEDELAKEIFPISSTSKFNYGVSWRSRHCTSSGDS